MAFRGRNMGSYNYNLGGDRGNEFNRIYLKNDPNVNSDERLKEDIQDIRYGIDIINDLRAVIYRLKVTDADKSLGIERNKIKHDIIAQEVREDLKRYNYDIED